MLYYFKVIKEFTFLIYISMLLIILLGRQEWGIFNSSKPLFKTKIKKQRYAASSVYSLYLFLTFILITQVNNLHQVSSRLTKNISTYFHLRFLKKRKQILLCFCCFLFKIYCLDEVTLKKTLDQNINL